MDFTIPSLLSTVDTMTVFLGNANFSSAQNMRMAQTKHSGFSIVERKTQRKPPRLLPPSEEVKKTQWINFICNGNVPTNINWKHINIYACADHSPTPTVRQEALWNSSLRNWRRLWRLSVWKEEVVCGVRVLNHRIHSPFLPHNFPIAPNTTYKSIFGCHY